MPNTSNKPKDVLPEGCKTWREANEARKERKRLKQEYLVAKLEKQKQKELAGSSEKPVKPEKYCGEPSTLSIAVPGSILDNAQSAELRTYLAGQIARAACVYKVDEVIVYDDIGIQDNMTTKTVSSLCDSGEIRPARKCCAQLARILQYLECPQYLRKEFFPNHQDLRYAGLLNPLDAPHHMRQQDNSQFREGVVINQPAKKGCYVNVGLLKHVKVDRPLQPGVRVTVEMLPSPPEAKRLLGRVVPPSWPKKETGIYWGYSVRIANSFNAVFTECPYKEGYDVTIGTSERGTPVETVSLTPHQHGLVVFGGLSGLEAALEADDVLTIDNPALIFDFYLNTCPDQGSRTIRTEEAILISLAELRSKLRPKVFSKAPSNLVLSRTLESDTVSIDDEAVSSSGIDTSINEEEPSEENSSKVSNGEERDELEDSLGVCVVQKKKKKRKMKMDEDISFEEKSAADKKKKKENLVLLETSIEGQKERKEQIVVGTSFEEESAAELQKQIVEESTMSLKNVSKIDGSTSTESGKKKWKGRSKRIKF